MKKNKSIITIENSKEFNGLHFTLKHTGKMEGFASLSTSVCDNARCRENAKIEGSVCQKCYASKMAKRYGENFRNPLSENTRILTSSIIDFDLLPVINRLYFRFESFGDLNNATQVINYFNICKKNHSTRFALWTKNPDFIQQAIDMGYKKPKNLNIILSSLFINVERKTAYDFVDKIFTVYDKNTIESQGININCGSKSCINCLKCYKKNDVRIINEKLK